MVYLPKSVLDIDPLKHPSKKIEPRRLAIDRLFSTGTSGATRQSEKQEPDLEPLHHPRSDPKAIKMVCNSDDQQNDDESASVIPRPPSPDSMYEVAEPRARSLAPLLGRRWWCASLGGERSGCLFCLEHRRRGSELQCARKVSGTSKSAEIYSRRSWYAEREAHGRGRVSTGVYRLNCPNPRSF